MKNFANVFPWLVVGLATLVFILFMMPSQPPANGMDIEGFGRLPIHDHGRPKPLDTLARTSVARMVNSQTIYAKDQTLSATQWLLNMLAVGMAEEYQSVTILDPGLVSELKLRENPNNRYSLRQLDEKKEQIKQLAAEAKNKDSKTQRDKDAIWIEYCLDNQRLARAEHVLDGLDKQKINMRSLTLVKIESLDVLSMLGLEQRPGFRYSIDEVTQNGGQFAKFYKKARELTLRRSQREKLTSPVDGQVLDLHDRLGIYSEWLALVGGTIVPVEGQTKWVTLNEALDARRRRWSRPRSGSWK